MRRFAMRIERSTLSVVIRGLPLLGISFTSSVSLYRSRSLEGPLDMVLWLIAPKSTATPVASIQPVNSQWLLPDPHWTTSPSLLTNMLKFRSTPRTGVQNCTIWLTVSNNWVKWVFPVSCGSLFGTERFWQISAGPHLSALGCIFRCEISLDVLGHNKCHMKGNWYTYKIV